MKLLNKILNNFYLDFIKEFNETFNNKVGYYAKGISKNLFNDLIKLNFAGIGCDKGVDIKNLLANKSHGFIQGNFDEEKNAFK